MDLMEESFSVFSGGQVLRFVDKHHSRATWHPADLDIYTTRAFGRRIVGFFEGEGYTSTLRPLGVDYDRHYVVESAIACVFLLRKAPDKLVDIVVSAAETPLIPIPLFYATHVVNVITAHSVRVAYPESSLAGRGYIRPMMKRTDVTDAAIEKYRARGYDIREFDQCTESSSHSGSSGFYCPHTTRDFQDAGTLCVYLSPPDPSVPFGPAGYDTFIFSAVDWKWGGNRCGACMKRSDERVREIGTGSTWCTFLLLLHRKLIR